MAGAFGIANSSTVLRNGADRVPLQNLWAEIEEAVRLYNAEKDVLTSLLTYSTVNAADAVAQSLTPTLMEESSEYGVPKAIRPDAPHELVGYRLVDHDLASRLSMRFCRDASAEQIRAVIVRMLEADRFTCQSAVLRRMFSTAVELNEYRHNCYGAYTGTDGSKPPDFMGRSFDTAHVHQIATGSTDLDSEDIELLAKHVTEHGYGLGGSRGKLVLMMNPEDVEDSAITSWRAGVTNANTKKARYDFIVSSSAPAFLSSENVVGAVPVDDIDGLPVLGSYGPISYVVQSNAIPAGFLAVASTGGADSDINPVAFREHPDPDWQGLRFIEGNVSREYPIVESFSMRTFGVGTRRRGAFVVAKLTAGSYSAPTEFAI